MSNPDAEAYEKEFRSLVAKFLEYLNRRPPARVSFLKDQNGGDWLDSPYAPTSGDMRPCVELFRDAFIEKSASMAEVAFADARRVLNEAYLFEIVAIGEFFLRFEERWKAIDLISVITNYSDYLIALEKLQKVAQDRGRKDVVSPEVEALILKCYELVGLAKRMQPQLQKKAKEKRTALGINVAVVLSLVIAVCAWWWPRQPAIAERPQVEGPKPSAPAN